MQWLTKPSPQLNGAQQITFINVGENTQSTLSLASSGAATVALTSTNYGLPSNLLSVTVTTGFISNKDRAVTVYDGYGQTSLTASSAGVPFQLVYTGSATGTTFTCSGSGTQNVTTTFTLTSPNAGEGAVINFANYPQVEQVVQYINGTGFWFAQVFGNNGQMPSSNLDVAGTIAVGSGSGFTNVTAQLTGWAWWFNTFAQGYCTATVSGQSTRGQVLSVVNAAPFSGAVSVPPVNADYASGFNVALTIPGWAVFADKNGPAIQSLGTQHAITATSPLGGNRARRYFTGSSIGDTVSATTGNAAALDSIRSTYAYPGIYANDPLTGINTLYGGMFVGAAAAAMATGNPPQIPLTNKALNGTGVEVNLTVSQIDQLQQAGVMPIWVSPQTGVPTIISDLTTWQLDANPENVFNQQVACRDYLTYSVVNALTPYVGTVADPLSLNRILQAVKATLNALMYNSGNAQGILVSWDPSTLRLVYTGALQLSAVTVNVIFVGQNRFITALVSVLPLSILVTAASVGPGGNVTINPGAAGNSTGPVIGSAPGGGNFGG